MLHTFNIYNNQTVRAQVVGKAPDNVLPLFHTYKAVGTEAYCTLYLVNGKYQAVFSHLEKDNNAPFPA